MAAKNVTGGEAAGKVDKVQPDTAAKTDKELADGYSAATDGVTKAVAALEGVLTDLRVQGVRVGEAAEERRRAQDKALYDMEKERQAVRDRQATEDATRAEAFKVRESAVKAAEDEILSLLKLKRDADGKVPEGKTVREAFAARVEEAEKAAEGKAKGIAEREAEAAKKLAAAEAATASALLKQENEQLKKANAALEQQNKDLLAAQQKVVGDMKEVAAGAFQAAGGVVAQGNSALGTAAGSARSGSGTRPG